MIGTYYGQPEQVISPAELAALKDKVAQIPTPATTTPKSEMTGGSVGATSGQFALADHQHPRLTSTTYATLGTDGTATVTFTRTFVNKPGVVLTEVDAAGQQPLSCVVTTFTQSNGLYTGCTIKGFRGQALPAVIALLGALTNFSVFAGPASGAVVSVIAVARSDVPAT